MNHRIFKPSILIVMACFVGCKAQAQSPTQEFSKVFSAISSEQIFKSSFPTVMTQLKGLCTERPADDADYLKKGNVSCVESASVNRLTLSGSEDPSLSMVQSSFRNVGQCTYMRSELTRRYGKPRSSDGVCDSEWHITTGKNNPQRIIKLRASKDTKLVFFTHQEEQGP